ncbi:MAG: VOC family protein [Burkholderiales bacterium]
MKPLAALGQIALPIADADRANAFYADALGLPLLFRFGDLVFFDLAGVRLMLGAGEGERNGAGGSCLYFRTDDIDDAHATLERRGVRFDEAPHLIAKMPDHELWMCFFKDPDGNQLALMEERR